MSKAFRLMYSMVFSWVRELSVPTNTFGRGSMNQRLSIPESHPACRVRR